MLSSLLNPLRPRRTPKEKKHRYSCKVKTKLSETMATHDFNIIPELTRRTQNQTKETSRCTQCQATLSTDSNDDLQSVVRAFLKDRRTNYTFWQTLSTAHGAPELIQCDMDTYSTPTDQTPSILDQNTQWQPESLEKAVEIYQKLNPEARPTILADRRQKPQGPNLLPKNCCKAEPTAYFYIDRSSNHRNSNYRSPGYLPICANCLSEIPEPIWDYRDYQANQPSN